MFGRVTRIVALIAVATYVWVALVVAPWHQLSAHVLPIAKSVGNHDSLSTVKRCHCRHHARGNSSALACDGRHTSKSSQESDDHSPNDEHGCSVCQILAQPFVHLDVADPTPTWVHMEFCLSDSVIQPLLGALIDPVSRGPPTV